MPKPSKPKKRLPAAEPLLPAGWAVPAVFRARLGDDVGRQRLMHNEGHLLLVLHAPPEPQERSRRGRLFWRNPQGDWKPQPLTHTEHAVGELLGEYESVAAELEATAEDANSARDHFEILTALTPLVRSAHNLSSVVQEARTAAQEDRKLILLRDRAYALTRQLDLLQQDTQNTVDFLVARRAEEQSAAAHRLNVLAALFFPIATLAGIFGMGLGHGLENWDASSAPLPLLGVLAIGLVLGVALAKYVSSK